MGMLASCGGSETKEVLETLPHLVTKSDNYELSDEQRDKLNEAMAAGEIENFSTAADGVPTCVDMGLSVYWATFNVGANNPYEYGEYYAWAETEPKENYNARSYKYGISNFDKKTKYYKALNSSPNFRLGLVRARGKFLQYPIRPPF